MHDEELRDGLAAWLQAIQRAPAPDVSVIRRRLRRRRARQSVAGAVVLVLVAGGAAAVHASSGPAPINSGPGPGTWPPCRSGQLRVDAAAAPDQSADSMELVANLYLLRIRNTSRTACSLTGWPRLSIAAPRAMRDVPVSDGTVSVWTARRGPVSRVVLPTQVLLRPGAQAAAVVTVTYTPSGAGCATDAVWSVAPPHRGRPTLIRRVTPSRTQQRHMLMICRYSTIEVSPVYPADVPITQNYPAAAPHQSVGTVSYAPPGANQQPRAAPYFVVIHQPKAVVYDSRTGKVTAVIRAPRAAPGGFTAVAAAGDDQTFVLATGTGFYELFVGPHGSQPDPLIRLPVPAEPAGTPFAVSGSGSELALALPQRASAAEASEIMVVSLSTGAVHTLRSPDPGTIQGLSWADPGSAAPDPGWAGNDRLLFGWTDASPNRRIARQRSGLRLLDPATSGTDLLASRLVVPASVRVGGLRGLDDPLINVDGTVVFATMTSHAGAARAESAVVEFSAATGRPLGTVTPLTNEAGARTWCGALWVNPSGSHALATCGPSWGEISGVQFTRENPRLNFSTDPSLVAW